jgi:chromosome segregation protein
MNENQNLNKYIESLETNLNKEKNNNNAKFSEWKKRIELLNEIEIENKNYKQNIELKDQELVFANKQIEKLTSDKKVDSLNNSKLKLEISNLNESYSNIEIECDEYKSKYNISNKEKNEIRNKNSNLEKDAKIANDKIQNLTNELEEIKINMESETFILKNKIQNLNIISDD